MDENKEYPSNSHSSKLRPSVPITSPPSATVKPEQQDADDRPKVEKAIEGTATVKRKTVGSRFKTIFTGVSMKDVVDDVVDQAIIPGIKGLLFDAGERALERWLGGGTGTGRAAAKGIVTNVAHVAYNKFSTPAGGIVGNRPTVMQPQQQMSRRAQAVFDFDEIEFQTRRDATIVLDLMYEHLQNYGTVSVAEFYGWADVKGNFTDQNHGWRTLEGAGPTRTRTGTYVLNLPDPIPLT